jgi:flavin-dependent dehydrogenase
MSSRFKKKYDMIVIGAGLAGLSAAYAASQEGEMSIAIVDFHAPGLHNPSPLTFVDTVNKFGLAHCIKEVYNTFRLCNPNGSSVTYQYSDYVLAVLDYRKACNEILSHVKGSGTIFIRSKVAEMIINPNEVLLKLDDGMVLHSSIVVDASGSANLSSRKYVALKKSFYSHVYGAQFANVKNECGSLCCYIFPDVNIGTGGGWYYSLGKSEASFGFAHISESPIFDARLMRQRFERALSSVEPYAGYLVKARIKHIEKGVIPITYSDQMNLGRLIVVGDAAGMATNWTCMGVEPALKYGNRAGMAAALYVSTKNSSALELYHKNWMIENKKTYDAFAAVSKWFWTSGHDFWEWAIKNDMAYLNPSQALERIRSNKYLIGKHTLLWRIVMHRIKLLLNKKYSGPIEYLRNS